MKIKPKYKIQEITKYIWSYTATCRFLSIFNENLPDYVSKDRNRNRKFWNTIAFKLDEEGLKYPSNICKKKLENLIRTYKACKKNKSTRFQFYDQIESLMTKTDPNFKMNYSEASHVEYLEANHDEYLEASQEEYLEDETIEPAEMKAEDVPKSLNKIVAQKKCKVLFPDPLGINRAKQSYLKAKNNAYKDYMFKSLQIKQQRLNLYKQKVKNDSRKAAALEELVQLLKQKIK